jgi:hypothetical protein
MAAKGWSTRFDDPIPLPRGRQLVTLQDAGTYITDGQGACPTSIEADASISGRKLQAWAEWEGHEHFVIVFPANL